MCIFTLFLSLSLFFISLSSHISLSLFSSGSSLHMSLSLSSSLSSLFSMQCVMCVMRLCCVCARFVPYCTEKRSRVKFSKRPCHMRHGRFEGTQRECFERTHGSVLKVVPPSPSISPLSSLSLLVCLRFFSFLLVCSVSSVSFFLVGTLSVLNDDDNFTVFFLPKNKSAPRLL